jgi:prevent-host-death family protein
MEVAVEVGVRALRDGLSKHLAEVRKGHTVTITDHGRAVARIVPVDGPTTFDRLVAEGVVRPPQRRRRGTPRPVPAEGSVSDLVAEQRQ